MKILFLDHGTTYAGAQVMATRLLPGLRERGFAIDALVGCPQIGGRPIPRTYRGLREAMHGYDLVYANTPRTAIAAATTNRPFLWHKHNPATTWAQRLAARRARRVISAARCGAPEGEHVRVIHNGVPHMVAAEPAHDLPGDRKILLLARYDHEKGHDVAIDALERMKTTATLLCAGPGAWAQPPHERVEVLGYRKDVAALLAACDVVLSASRCDEAGPLVVLEAQMAGVPVVATAVGETPDLVLDGVTAFLVPKEDPGAMAAALDRALSVDRETWAWQGREHARRFTMEAYTEAVAGVLRECA